jgi:small subunit ribosomal protein S9
MAEQPEQAKGEQDEQKPSEAPAEATATATAEKPKEQPSRSAPPPPEGQHYWWGTGRRKEAVARVRIRPGEGQFLINGRPVEVYFTQDRDRNGVTTPLRAARMAKSWDIWANVKGGGYTGQAGAVRLGLARALVKAVPDVEDELRQRGLLTRDARTVERKKPGQPGARKKFQFSKR